MKIDSPKHGKAVQLGTLRPGTVVKDGRHFYLVSFRTKNHQVTMISLNSGSVFTATKDTCMVPYPNAILVPGDPNGEAE